MDESGEYYQETLEAMGRRAKECARYAAGLGEDEKNAVLLCCAETVEKDAEFLIFENRKDMEKMDFARAAFADRLLLTPGRVRAIAERLRNVARLENPLNEIFSMKTLPNGLQVGRKRVPLGVVGLIYEARPNVTADCFALCFKAGNACILRGGSEAHNSNTAIMSVLHDALKTLNHPAELAQLIADTSRETARRFMRMNPYVDVLIPRGSQALIDDAVENATIPVIATGAGNCHIFVDAAADFDAAVSIVVNAKTQRPSVCNACEKLLVHEAAADRFLPVIGRALKENRV